MTQQNECHLPRLELRGTYYSRQKEMHGRIWLVQEITSLRFTRQEISLARLQCDLTPMVRNLDSREEPLDACKQGGDMSNLFQKINSAISVSHEFKSGERAEAETRREGTVVV